MNFKKRILGIIKGPGYIILSGVIVLVALLSITFTSETTVFYGIAETREIVINNKNPVEIKKIHVVAGQTVNKGDPIIELNRSELKIRITELTSLIQQKRAQHKINKEFNKELKSIGSDSGSGEDNSRNPILIEIQSLEEELALLTREKDELYITAQINGVIGSVNYKDGEKVSPFSPIITLHTKSPSYVKGYIHEYVYNRITNGNEVRVTSQSGTEQAVTGRVVGVGSRIVKYPERLQRHPDVKQWGRELLIKIPDENYFLLGEKVRISE